MVESGGYAYADEWIKNHWDGQHYSALCKEHNQAFGTSIPRANFQYHCKCLGLESKGRYFTEEEKKWLRSYYPDHGEKKTVEMFYRLFGKKMGVKTLRRYCNVWLGLKTTDECKYGHRRAKIGDTLINCRGEVKIKTENGWVGYANQIMKPPKGSVVIHLDRDKTNNKPENLAVAKNGYMALMRNYDLWSENAEITRTSIKWCELYELINKERRKRSEDAIHL